jgi:5-amino-6-(5-phospho-D-ribitylamino)uracil phosphatase
MRNLELLKASVLPRLKAAYFDIDGTILGSSDVVTERTLSAITMLSDAGIKIGLATGRPRFATDAIRKILPLSAPCLYFSGGLLYDEMKHEAIEEHLLEPASIRACIDFVRKFFGTEVNIEVYTKSDLYVETLNELNKIHTGYLQRAPEVSDLEPVLKSKRVFKLVVMGYRTGGYTDCIKKLSESLPDFKMAVSYGARHPDIFFLNITSQDADRVRSLQKIIDILNITKDEIICFGDAESDLPFIQNTEFGVAMGNAPEKVRDFAKIVTDDVERDGVAIAIEKLFGDSN